MYKKGDLSCVPPPHRKLYDARDDDNDVVGPVAYLPHSCDEWIIGGVPEVRALISDLLRAVAYLEDNAA